MKDEDLIKKLENVELPGVELPSHQRRLKMALLESGYLRKRQSATVLARVKNKIKGGVDTIMGIFVSRRPVWQTVLASAMAIALITGLSITLPSLFGQSDEALAAEIAQNSPEVIAALGGEDISTVEVLETKDGMATVKVGGTLGTIITVEVDLLTKIATQVIVGPQLTDEEKEKALNILNADPEVQALFAQGAVIHALLPIEFTLIAITGEEVTETWAQAWINLGDKQYGAQVDLVRGRVVSLSD
jgi:hypothetical protein